jgi:hypothetical protein
MSSLLGTGSDNLAGRYARRPAPSRAAAANAVCQRCLQARTSPADVCCYQEADNLQQVNQPLWHGAGVQAGHWTYECKNPASYTARPTRTQQLLNPKVRPRFMDPSELLPDARGAAGDAAQPGAKKRKKREAPSSSSSSDSDSDSDSDSSGAALRLCAAAGCAVCELRGCVSLVPGPGQLQHSSSGALCHCQARVKSVCPAR